MTLLDKWTLSQRVDPFYSYLHMTDELGTGEVYLLDAAAETQSAYKMSIIAALPIVEVQIKDGTVVLAAEDLLLETLVNAVHRHGYDSVEDTNAQQAAESYYRPSVIAGQRAVFVPDDPMALLEALRIEIRSFFGDRVLSPFSQGFLGYIGFDAVHYLESLPKTTTDDRNLPDVRLQWHGVVLHLVEDHLSLYSGIDVLQDYLPAAKVQQLRAKRDRIQAMAEGWVNEPPVAPSMFPADAASSAAGMLRADAMLQADGISSAEERADRLENTEEQAGFSEDISQTDFEQNVRAAKSYIEAGDIFQVVLSKRIRIPKRMHPYEAYDRLRKINPSPYMFMSEYPDMRLFGASPEVQFRAAAGRAEMKPIAGTSKGRGATPEEDKRLQQRLLDDEKERAEHIMLVDLCRNDLGRVSRIGSVHVEDFLTVEPYSHLFHLVSTVRSDLRDDVNVFHALLATFPAGTLSGAPKIRAMEIIDELEPYRRGPYGGMIGMIDFDANANTAIIIRSIVETDNTYFAQVGAGIVADSDPEQEWLECGHKAGAILAVLNEKSRVQV